MGSVQRSVRFPDDLVATVDDLASRESRSFAQTVVLLVRRGLDMTGPDAHVNLMPDGSMITDTDLTEQESAKGPVSRLFERRG